MKRLTEVGVVRFFGRCFASDWPGRCIRCSRSSFSQLDGLLSALGQGLPDSMVLKTSLELVPTDPGFRQSSRERTSYNHQIQSQHKVYLIHRHIIWFNSEDLLNIIFFKIFLICYSDEFCALSMAPGVDPTHLDMQNPTLHPDFKENRKKSNPKARSNE